MKPYLYILLILITVRGAFWFFYAGVAIYPSRLFAILFAIKLVFHNCCFKSNNRLIGYWSLFLVTWLCYSIMQLLWVSDINSGIRQWLLLATGVFIVYSIMVTTHSLKDITHLSQALTIICLFNAGMGAWEHFTKRPFLLSRFGDFSARTQGLIPFRFFSPAGAHGNPNDFATALFFLAALSTGILFSKGKIIWKLLAVVSGICSFVVIIWTGSRTNMVALPAFAACVLLLAANASRKSLYLIIVLCTICSSIVISLYQEDALAMSNSYYSEVETLANWQNNPRVGLLINAVYTANETFGLGAGPNNAHRYMAEGPVSVAHLTAPHSLYAELLSEYGYLITGGFLYLIISLVLYLFRVWRYFPVAEIRPYAMHGIIVLTFAGYVTFSPSSTINLHEFWFALGYCLALVNICGSENAMKDWSWSARFPATTRV